MANDVRFYPIRDEEGPPVVTMSVRFGEMYFSFRLPLQLARAAHARLGEALAVSGRHAARSKRGEGGESAD